MKNHSSLVVRRHGKVFWQFFTTDAMAIDAYYVYCCDHDNFSYSIRLSDGGRIAGHIPKAARNPQQSLQ